MIPTAPIPAADGRQRGLRTPLSSPLIAAPGFSILLLLAPASALAEKADREKPINLEADRVTVDDARQISTFTGRVVLTQGTLVIRGDRMEVRQDEQGFNSGTTWGNLAYFRQK